MATEKPRKKGTKLYELEDEDEKSFGTIISISPNLVRAELSEGQMYEMVKIGPNQVLGEIIRMQETQPVIQLYGRPTGLQVGDVVARTKKPFTIELGPGLIGNVCDGFQRSYEGMAGGGINMYTSQNYEDAASVLDKQKLWEFEPQNFKIGDKINGGDIFGRVYETEQLAHWIMLPPKKEGTIVQIAPTGFYSLEEEVLVIEFLGVQTSFTMVQRWPVRQPRPIESPRTGDRACYPICTGVRHVDTLFPIALGRGCAIVGGAATGKATLCRTIARNSNPDIVIYVSCGKRGTDYAEMGIDYPELKMKTHSIVSPADMSVACQQAAGYTGITTAEYFRDQGFNVTMVMDSLTHWVDELDLIGPYQLIDPYTYVSVATTSLYERSGKVNCIGSPTRTGTTTLLATVRPPKRDFADRVASAAFNIFSTFLIMDNKLALKRIYPTINGNSFCRAPKLEHDFERMQLKIKEILSQSEEVDEIVQLVGFDSLGEDLKLQWEVGKMIKEYFLQQDLFSKNDKMCPMYKTRWMMKNILTFYNHASRLMEAFLFSHIKSTMSEILFKLSRMKNEDPRDGEEAVVSRMKRLNKEIKDAFSHHT